MEEKECHVVIMAGGVGSRFWPMSTPEYPKQFIDVMGVGKSLLQLTVDRFLPICSIRNIWIVTGEKYVDIVRSQITDLPVDNILSEPVARNTAPCIGYACWKIFQRHPKARIVVTPSDALVLDTNEFQLVIRKALDFIHKEDAIVTVGIKPTRPEIGYGYIHTVKIPSEKEIIGVSSFKEKPNLETAQQYLRAGDYLWNAGIFIWKIETILLAFRKYIPEIAILLDEMARDFYTDKEKSTVKKIFPSCQNISIDYAVMEKSRKIYTLFTDCGWSDLGSWGALHTLLSKDEHANTVVGNGVSLYNCQDCTVHASTSEKMVIEGLKGYIVAENNGQILICRRSEEQKIKDFS